VERRRDSIRAADQVTESTNVPCNKLVITRESG
jgi:hypothetical protein